MPKSSRVCCIPGCADTPRTGEKSTVPLKFYRFPSDNPFTPWRREKRQRWIEAVGLKHQDGSPWQPTKNTFICTAHFVGGEKSENPYSPSYVPTLFPISYGTLNIAKPLKRVPGILKTKKTKVTSSIEKADASNTNGKVFTADVVMEEMPSPLLQPKTEPQMNHCNPIFTSKRSIGSQANLPQDEQHPGTNYFMCNMQVNNGICTAELQVNIASTVDQAVECDASLDMMTRRDVACGPGFYEKQDSQIIGFQGITSIRNDAELTEFCGITFPTFNLILSLLRDMPEKKLNTRNKLLIFLMKLKLDLTYSALGVLFSVHQSTICRTFIEILQCLPTLLEEYIYWPTKETVEKNLPQIIRMKYPNCRAFIDCIEIPVGTPLTVEQRKSMYSKSEETFTMKFLLASTPNGFISFKSKCYGGGTSDVTIVDDTEFLDFIESGDLLIADKGFSDIQTGVENKNAAFIMLPSYNITQFSYPGVFSRRNHIKRCIERVKIFRILSFLPTDMLPHADSIIQVCCSLVNLQLPMSQSK